MTGVLDYLSRLLGGIAFWVVVLPWQQALRVRLGRHVRLLREGIYLKIPIIDAVLVESTRRRTSMMPVQTLSTADGATLTISAVVGYSIGDLEQLYRTLHHAEDTIIQSTQGALAARVFQMHRHELDAARLCEHVGDELAETFAAYGLRDVTLHVTDFAFMRAIRLVQAQGWFHGRVLDTQGTPRGGGA